MTPTKEEFRDTLMRMVVARRYQKRLERMKCFREVTNYFGERAGARLRKYTMQKKQGRHRSNGWWG